MFISVLSKYSLKISINWRPQLLVPSNENMTSLSDVEQVLVVYQIGWVILYDVVQTTNKCLAFIIV